MASNLHPENEGQLFESHLSVAELRQIGDEFRVQYPLALVRAFTREAIDLFTSSGIQEELANAQKLKEQKGFTANIRITPTGMPDTTRIANPEAMETTVSFAWSRDGETSEIYIRYVEDGSLHILSGIPTDDKKYEKVSLPKPSNPDVTFSNAYDMVFQTNINMSQHPDETPEEVKSAVYKQIRNSVKQALATPIVFDETQTEAPQI